VLTQKLAAVESLATVEARQIHNWDRQVSHCIHACKSFIRFEISDGILLAKVEPEHFVEDIVIKWFKARFPLFTIVISSSRGIFIFDDKFHIENSTFNMEILKNNDKLLSELSLVEDVWEDYYASQFIGERKNTKLFKKNIPKKYLNWQVLSTEKKSSNKNKILNLYI